MQKRLSWPWIIVISIALLLLLLGLAVWLIIRINTTDYGALPQQQVYVRVFGKAPPKGVSDLKIAGHGFLAGHDLWMRFHATNNVIDSFISSIDAQKLTAIEAKDLTSLRIIRGEISGRDERDPRRAGWEEALRIHNAETYDFAVDRPYTGWFGEMVIDRQRGLVYIYANLL